MLQAAISGRLSTNAGGIPVHLATPAAAAQTILDRLDLPIVLVRSNRSVVLANAAAHRFEARGDCIRFIGDRLRVVDPREHRALESFLAGDTHSTHGLHPRLSLGNREMAARACLLVVEWLDRAATDGDPVAILLVHEFRVAIEPELLSDRYGLTQTEARFVAALFVDPSLKSVACRCRISLNTAKTHLKHVFAKCGVGSKAELLRLVALAPRTV
jgi:DNA-binding CsgD family transcriptional regulator